MLSGPDSDAAHQAMMATLNRRLKPASIDAEADHRETSVREAVSQPLPTSAPVLLQWLDPVVNPDKSGYVKDTTGAYTVLKERRSDGGWRYIAFFGSTVLGPSCVLLGDAKGYCLRHHREHP
jgi:hypothetical protein